MKPYPPSQTLLESLPIAAEAWRSVLMDFIFGLAPDRQDWTNVLDFVDRFSKLNPWMPDNAAITAVETATYFVDAVFRHYQLLE